MRRCGQCYKLFDNEHHTHCPFCNGGYISPKEIKANERCDK